MFARFRLCTNAGAKHAWGRTLTGCHSGLAPLKPRDGEGNRRISPALRLEFSAPVQHLVVQGVEDDVNVCRRSVELHPPAESQRGRRGPFADVSVKEIRSDPTHRDGDIQTELFSDVVFRPIQRQLAGHC